MKTKSLQFRKAMSAALFVLLLSVAGMKNALAQTQVATLQHGDDISVFYGQNAFVEAHIAAEAGDVITLSSGTFTSCNITKAITLRGSGCVWDSISASFPTIISNEIILNVPNSENYHLIIEGIHFTGNLKYQSLYYPCFFKCNFNSLSYNNVNNNNPPSMYNAQFVNCMLRELFLAQSYNVHTLNTTLVNCVIWNGHFSCFVNAYNSFFRFNSPLNDMNAYNCIISQTQSSYSFGGNSIAYNCIGIRESTSSSVFTGQNFGSMTVNSYTDVFETFDGTAFSYLEKFLLKDEVASGFLGIDGTEVGIYGGTAPYNPRPSHMMVKHCNVANKSTVDGKLSVEIEVYTEDE